MVCTGYMVETRTLTYQCHNVTVLSGVKETNGDSLASIDWILASAGDGGGRNTQLIYSLTCLLGSSLNHIMDI